MRLLRGFGLFWWDFVIGDDWRLAALVVLGLTATAVIAHETDVPAWWILPVMVVAGLAASLRGVRRRPPGGRG